MAGLLLLVLVDVVAVAVAVACSLLTVPTAAVFHPHDLIPSFSGHVEGDEQEGYGSGNPQQPHSFTDGRGTYKFMAHEFLEAHNRVRARYGVPPLRWSNKLAKYARRWSSARRFDCVLMHSPGSPYGENVFWGTGWDWRAGDAVSSWASEAAFYDWRSQACHPGQMCGHFTQLVWNDTQLVGCGRSECFAGGVFITCSYDPPGNWLGEAPLS